MENKKEKCLGYLLVLTGVLILFFNVVFVSAVRLPLVGGDSETWGTVLNEYLTRLSGANATELNITGNASIGGNLTVSGNLILGEKITFAFGEIIDNIKDGWIRVAGGLNVTEGLQVGGGVNITGNLYVSESNEANATGIIYLGSSESDGLEYIKFNYSQGTNGKFVFSAPLVIPASSPAITFVDANDPTNTSKQKSIEFDPDNLEISTGDIFTGSFGNNDGSPQIGKVFFRIGPQNLVTPSGVGTFLGFNAPPIFGGDLANFQVGGKSRFRVTNTGDIIIRSGVMKNSAPILNIEQIWDNASATFTGWLLNINDTGSSPDSKFIELQQDGSTKFFVKKDGSVTADSFIGDGSQLTGVGGGLVDSVNLTSGTYTGAITNGSFSGYKAADTICNLEYSGSHFCTEFEVATWSSKSISNDDAWVIAGGPKFVPADIPVNDCSGWSHGVSGTYLGNYWHFNSTTGGDPRAIHCGTSLKLACCTY